MDKEKEKTIESYIVGCNILTREVLYNLDLQDVPITLFFSTFGKKSPEEVITFLNNPNNAYSLGLLGSRYHHSGNIKAYNGLTSDLINGGKNTIPARRSNYHGH